MISRDKKLHYEFLPEMTELIEKPSNVLTTIIMYLCFSLIIAAVVWACFTRLDIVVTANGSVDTVSPLATVRYTTAGDVEEVYVADGDILQKGDAICRLNAENEELSLEETEYNLELLEIQQELYEKLYEKYKDDDYTSLACDTSSYGAGSLIAEAVVLENEIFIDNLKETDEEERAALKLDRLYSVMNNINRINVEIEKAKSKKESIENEIAGMTVTANTSGAISLVEKLYPGKTVSNGDTLGYITPQDNKYIFRAYVADEDITRIKTGDKVRLRFSAYDDTAYEYIEGVIGKAGDVPIKQEGTGTVYAVDISMTGVPEDIRSGMEGRVDIVIGSRSVMDYFVEPFRKGLDDSLKEM